MYIERTDFAEAPPPKFQRLKPDGEVRLMGAYIVRCVQVVKNEAGDIVACCISLGIRINNQNFFPFCSQCS